MSPQSFPESNQTLVQSGAIADNSMLYPEYPIFVGVTKVGEVRHVLSYWKPNVEELNALNNGASITVMQIGGKEFQQLHLFIDEVIKEEQP